MPSSDKISNSSANSEFVDASLTSNAKNVTPNIIDSAHSNSTVHVAAKPSTSGSGKSESKADSDQLDITKRFVPPQTYEFKKRKFGKGDNVRERSCSHRWFTDFDWAHYDPVKDLLFCFTCIRASKLKLVTAAKKLPKIFTTDGFCYWNDGKKALEGHQKSEYHQEADMKLKYRTHGKAIVDVLDASAAQERTLNAEHLKTVIRVLKLCATQNIAPRGSTQDNSNLHQILMLLGEYNESVRKSMSRRITYTDGKVQNELFALMSNEVARKIISNIQNSGMYAILVDETTDARNKQQLVFCLRWVDDDLTTHEEFLGMHEIDSADSETITSVIKDILLRYNLSLDMCYGQCYDGASVMSGSRSGVAARIQQENKKALYVHCLAHALNLAVSSVCDKSKILKQTFDIVNEICKLVKLSPKRETWLEALQSQSSDEEDPETTSHVKIKRFCPTRWTVRAATIRSVKANYSLLMQLWKKVDEDGKTPADIKLRALGVLTKMKSFDFLFGIELAEQILSKTDHLSSYLQTQGISQTYIFFDYLHATWLCLIAILILSE